jgi:tetratricopeptide (TPR) repeat protein
MVRNGLFASLSVLLSLVLGVHSVRGEDSESQLRRQLAMQTALQQGRDNLQRGEYQAAVYCLEKEVARADGNRDYLNALREAYRGYVQELQRSNRADEARIYRERLKILDPGYHLEQNATHPRAVPLTTVLAAQATPNATPPRPTAAYTARPQMPEETDPFADTNKAPLAGNNSLLDRARREFDGKNYAAANRLFEEANRLDGKSLAPYRELWAYSKLSVAAEALNKGGWLAPPEAEKETLAALNLSTSPELQRQGKEMLRAIGERRIEIRHVPAQGKNWPEVETANFRIIYHQSRELAEQAARVAETTRALVNRKWFGEDAAPWNPKCLIFLYPNAEMYARQTGKSSKSPGHSTLEINVELERVVRRQIDLHCDQADLLTHTLPHETTHAVLAGRFGKHDLPSWADEGMAVLSEPREKVESYLTTVTSLQSRRELFSIAELMNMKSYSNRVSAFYAQSVSLVDFLCAQQGGPQAFSRFVRDGLAGGWETSLQRYYGFHDFNDLEARWLRSIGKDSTRAELSAPRR